MPRPAPDIDELLLRAAHGDREVLVLRHLEQLSTRETPAVQGISEGAVKTRPLRALEHLRELLIPNAEGE